jgi:hypothetical protein
MASRSEYVSRLNPVECAFKAQAAIVAEPSVVGMVEDSLVLVRKLRSNTFHTVVRARLKPSAEGTNVMLTAGVDRVVFVFGCVFLSAFLAISVMFLLAYLRVFQSFQFSDEDRKNWLFLTMPMICAVLGIVLAQLGRYQARHEAPFLTQMLVDAMGAKALGKTAARDRNERRKEGRPAPPKSETRDEITGDLGDLGELGEIGDIEVVHAADE